MDDAVPLRPRNLRVGCWRHSLEGKRKSKADDALQGMREGNLASHLQTRIADSMTEPNQITGPNRGRPPQLRIRRLLAAHVGQFCRSAKMHPLTANVLLLVYCDRSASY